MEINGSEKGKVLESGCHEFQTPEKSEHSMSGVCGGIDNIGSSHVDSVLDDALQRGQMSPRDGCQTAVLCSDGSGATQCGCKSC